MENVRHFFPKKTYGPADWRRMIYMTKVRQEQESVFGAFDCPDASQMTPARSRSTTAVQALSLLNSQFINRQAAFLADDISDSADSLPEQVKLAVFRTLCRPAKPFELEILNGIATEQGLSQVCRILLNLNEFVFIHGPFWEAMSICVSNC